MKRSPSLEPLSHDHYHGLQMAKRLREALAAGEDPASLAEETSLFRDNHLRPHFRAEEELLLPVLDGEHRALGDRMLRDHAQLLYIVENLEVFPERRPESLAAFSRFLADHIRFEERELFPTIERTADPESLERIRLRLNAVPGD